MITEERLKGAYSEGEALAIYNEVKQSGDLIGFCRTYMNHEDYQVARNALWGVTKASKAEHAQLQPLLHHRFSDADRQRFCPSPVAPSY